MAPGTVVVDDHIDIFTGVYEATIDLVSTTAHPIPDSLLQATANAAARRLHDLPPFGTTDSIQ